MLKYMLENAQEKFTKDNRFFTINSRVSLFSSLINNSDEFTESVTFLFVFLQEFFIV